MINAKGYAQIFFPDGNRESMVRFDGKTAQVVHGANVELDTFTCAHCGSVEHVQPRVDVNAVGFCRSCMKPICARCSSKPCAPFEKRLIESEERSRFRAIIDGD